MGRDMKNQTDDGMSKEKIKEDSCNRGDGDMVEIAKRWSLRAMKPYVILTQDRKQNDLPVKKRIDGSKSEIHLSIKEINQGGQVSIMLPHQSKTRE